MNFIRRRRVGPRAPIRNSSITTRSTKAGTLRPGNSRSSSPKRFARDSDPSANRPEKVPHTHRRSTMPDPSQFNIDRACPGRWTVTFSNPPINMFVPTTIVEIDKLMTDLEADPSVRVVVFQSANPEFFVAHLDV